MERMQMRIFLHFLSDLRAPLLIIYPLPLLLYFIDDTLFREQRLGIDGSMIMKNRLSNCLQTIATASFHSSKQSFPEVIKNPSNPSIPILYQQYRSFELPDRISYFFVFTNQNILYFCILQTIIRSAAKPAPQTIGPLRQLRVSVFSKGCCFSGGVSNLSQ